MRLTLIPRASSRQPMEAAARPLPSEDTTPPVTKMYFADMSATSLDELEICAGWARLSIAGSAAGSNGVEFPDLGSVRKTHHRPRINADKNAGISSYPLLSAFIRVDVPRRQLRRTG